MRGCLKQIPHTYRKGDYITLKKAGILWKLAISQEGPYNVIKHNNNGSILIEKHLQTSTCQCNKSCSILLQDGNSYYEQKLNDNNFTI